VASANGCVIFDLHGICSSDDSITAFSDVMTRLLLSSSCIKLFYGFEQDMEKLRSSWPCVAAFGIGARRCLELNHLASAIRADMRNKSLSDVCLAFLGQSLDKSQRLSNWAARPLSSPQIMYAAIDVYAPLLVFNRLGLNSCVSDEGSTSPDNLKSFDSLFFDVQAVETPQNGSKMLPCVSNSTKVPADVADSVSAKTLPVIDEICFTVLAHQDTVHSSDPVSSAPESTPTERRDDALPSPNPPLSLNCLGTQDVITALGKCGEGLAFELIHLPAEVEGCGRGTESKFEAFDRIQSHADAVGMARCQVYVAFDKDLILSV
jgi:hypothetical protein